MYLDRALVVMDLAPRCTGDATQNAGFSLGSPWLPLLERIFESRNVSSLRHDPNFDFQLHLSVARYKTATVVVISWNL